MKILFQRESENLNCIVSCKDNSRIETPSEFFNALTTSTTEWVKNTDIGKKAFEYSCEDFNVGDLSSYLGDEDLNNILLTNGICELEINLIDVEGFFNYDKRLVDCI
jgi:hypothetical protein